MAPPTSVSSTRSHFVGSRLSTRAHVPTARRRTGRPSASFAPCSTAGPTARSTAQAANAHAHLTAGSGTTTIDADTQPSATNPRSAEPTCSGPTPRFPRSTERVLAGQRLADDERVHLVRALVREHRLEV